MSIKLIVEADDPEVEGLLEYLQSKGGDSAWKDIALLNRAVKWLEASESIRYTLTQAHFDGCLSVVDTGQSDLSQNDVRLVLREG